jgi:hypothetical protein
VIEPCPDVEFPFWERFEKIRTGSPPLPGVVAAKELAMTAIDMHTPAGGGGTSNQEKLMRALISALVVAGVVGFALPAVADDAVMAPNKPKAAGRAIDDGGSTVTAPNKAKAAGRAIDDGTAVKAPNKEKAGRAIDDGTVKAPNKEKAAGRAIDDGTVKTNKPKQYGRSIAAEKQDPTVKSKAKKHTDPGRAADEQKASK